MLVPFFVQKPVKKRFYMYSLLEKYTEGESQMKDKIFSVLQRVGRSFMLPIAILPVAGLLLGIGSSFTNATTIETYGLTKILGDGTLLHSLLVIMNSVGSAVVWHKKKKKLQLCPQ